TTKVMNNTYTPSMAFCSYNNDDYIEVDSAFYYDAQNNIDLTNSFDDTFEYDLFQCKLFNETLFELPEGSIGGIYFFTFNSSTNFVDMVIGDLSDLNNFLKNQTSQIDIHSNTDEHFLIGNYSTLRYAETRYVDLDGSKTHRSFILSTIGEFPKDVTH